MGITAGDGRAVIWPLLVGVNRAKQLLMTGGSIAITTRKSSKNWTGNQVGPGLLNKMRFSQLCIERVKQ